MDSLAELIAQAEAGDKEATRELCGMAAHCLQTGVPMHPFLQGYIAGALARFGRGGTFNSAFAPMGRQPPEVTQARRTIGDMSLVYWVDRAIADGLSTSKDGDPGPAFERVAQSFGLAPSTVRDRYYAKRQITESCENCENQ